MNQYYKQQVKNTIKNIVWFCLENWINFDISYIEACWEIELKVSTMDWFEYYNKKWWGSKYNYHELKKQYKIYLTN